MLATASTAEHIIREDGQAAEGGHPRACSVNLVLINDPRLIITPFALESNRASDLTGNAQPIKYDHGPRSVLQQGEEQLQIAVTEALKRSHSAVDHGTEKERNGCGDGAIRFVPADEYDAVCLAFAAVTTNQQGNDEQRAMSQLGRLNGILRAAAGLPKTGEQCRGGIMLIILQLSCSYSPWSRLREGDVLGEVRYVTTSVLSSMAIVYIPTP